MWFLVGGRACALWTGGACLVPVSGYPAHVLVGLDGRVAGVHEDDLEPLVVAVLPDPVAVEDLHVGVLPGYPLLCHELPALRGGVLGDAHALLPVAEDGPQLPAAAPQD